MLLIIFPSNRASFKYKQKITGSINVPLKNVRNIWRTLEMSLKNCEINLILTWSATRIISNSAANQAGTFEITDT